jgi:hypothetical protein
VKTQCFVELVDDAGTAFHIQFFENIRQVCKIVDHTSVRPRHRRAASLAHDHPRSPAEHVGFLHHDIDVRSSRIAQLTRARVIGEVLVKTEARNSGAGDGITLSRLSVSQTSSPVVCQSNRCPNGTPPENCGARAAVKFG